MVDRSLAALVFPGRTRAGDGAQLRVPGNPLSDNELITARTHLLWRSGPGSETLKEWRNSIPVP
jgi:hypothetical protein